MAVLASERGKATAWCRGRRTEGTAFLATDGAAALVTFALHGNAPNEAVLHFFELAQDPRWSFCVRPLEAWNQQMHSTNALTDSCRSRSYVQTYALSLSLS